MAIYGDKQFSPFEKEKISNRSQTKVWNIECLQENNRLGYCKKRNH